MLHSNRNLIREGKCSGFGVLKTFSEGRKEGRNENMVILEGGRHKAGFRRRPVYGKDGKWRKEFHV